MTTTAPVRWGIAGPGRMAENFIRDFQHVPGAVPVAVASRSLERAKDFGIRHGLRRAHGCYQRLCADPEVDVVYIATPHPQHRAIALEAIANGKAVLVEKAFAATLDGAQEVVDAARAAQVFCMEAMWTRFMPATRELHRVVDSGQLGPLRAVMGDLYAHRAFDPDDRLFARHLGGGAVLDLGVYVLSFANDFLGVPDRMQVSGTHYPNGADAQVGFLLDHADGSQATLACGLRAPGPARMVVVGEDGWAELHSQFHHSSSVSIHRRGVAPQRLELPPTGRGYSHEIEAVSQAVREGCTEHEWMPLDDTLAVQRLMQQALDELRVEHRDDAHLPSHGDHC